ncbi:MAG: sugar transferase [Kiritimatiellae bacterium]|nr:sugar transferase [Kiritimatiellia bacterium]MDD4341182.1 sugar transferase [Kiritimatiellia bacterium]
MLRRSFRFQSELAALVDAVFVAGALLVALATHKLLAWLFPGGFATFDMFWSNAWIYILVVPVWSFILDFSGMYHHFIGLPRWSILRRAIKGGLLSFAVLLGLLYVLKLHMVPRTILGIHCLYSIGAIFLRAAFLQPFLLRLESRRRLLLAGNPEQAASICGWLQAPQRTPFFEIIGFLPPRGVAPPPGLEVPGSIENFSDVLHDSVVDAVILLPRALPQDQIDACLKQCETEGTEAWLLPDFLRTAIAQVTLDELADEPVLLFSTSPKSPWALMLKRTLDILLSAAALIILSPLMLAIAIVIRVTSPGPILFSQKRSTVRGRTFNMLKFRTMVQNAEDIRHELDDHNEVTGPVFKIKDDPRITPIGRWLRRYSLDELPQLWNVLKGEMALVGPRPPIPAEVAEYENWQRRRLSMRSGCTCLWQIGGRNELSFDDWMKLDLKYIDTWSLGLDFQILFKTIGTILRGTGY